MVQIEPFTAQRWADSQSHPVKHDLFSSCSAPISIEELSSLSESKAEADSFRSSLLSTPLDYAEQFQGSKNLRNTLATLYSAKAPSTLPVDNVLITTGASLANFFVFQVLLEPGDHVIVQYPTYQQLYSLPKANGIEVSLWRNKEKEKWRLDLEELKALLQPNTKMIVLTNPGNPTGAVILRSQLIDIANLAKEHSLILFSDEVYRPLFHGITPVDQEFPPSALSLDYDNVLVSGSMSKCYSLPGTRVGWLASRNSDYIGRCLNYSAYSSISVGRFDQAVAAFALDSNCLHQLLRRNINLAKQNLDKLEAFIEQHRWACDWVRPVAASVAFVKFQKMGKPVDDVEFCKLLREKKGVLLLPGSLAFGNNSNDFQGYVRIGYAMKSETIEAGLKALGEFMEEEFETIPLADKKLLAVR